MSAYSQLYACTVLAVIAPVPAVDSHIVHSQNRGRGKNEGVREESGGGEGGGSNVNLVAFSYAIWY